MKGKWAMTYVLPATPEHFHAFRVTDLGEQVPMHLVLVWPEDSNLPLYWAFIDISWLPDPQDHVDMTRIPHVAVDADALPGYYTEIISDRIREGLPVPFDLGTGRN